MKRMLVKKITPKTKNETFKDFSPKLLNSLKHLKLNATTDSFKTQVNLKINTNINFFGRVFNLIYTDFFQEKRKEIAKIKRNIK